MTMEAVLPIVDWVLSDSSCHKLSHAQQYPFIKWTAMKAQVSGVGSASPCHSISPAVLSLPSAHEFDLLKISVKYRLIVFTRI